MNNYFKSEETARPGDLIATSHFGQCIILEITDGTALVANQHTCEETCVLIGDCDLISHPRFVDSDLECRCAKCGGDRATLGGGMHMGDTHCAACDDENEARENAL